MLACRYLLVGFLIFAGATHGSAKAQDSQKKVVLSGIMDNVTHEIVGAVVAAAYERAGIPMEIRWVPAKRALNEANSGRSDGDVGRIEGTEKVWPNLVPVPTPVMVFKAHAYSTNVDAKINDWSDLKPYRIGIIRGIRYSDIATENMQRKEANSPQQLMHLLINNYVDVVVLTDNVAYLTITRDFPKAGIHPVGGLLANQPLYHFVNRRNRKLVARLDAALQEMTASGEIEKIKQRALNEIALSY